jgi:heat shock protein HspQ
MIDRICCEKSMIKIENADFMNGDINNIDMWVCGLCGRIIEERDYSIDEEEWLNLADTYAELQETSYYKELTKENDTQNYISPESLDNLREANKLRLELQGLLESPERDFEKVKELKSRIIELDKKSGWNE